MSEKNIFRKKILFPLSYACMVGLAIWGATGLIPDGMAKSGTVAPYFMSVEPASGDEMKMAQIDMDLQIPPIDEKEIIDTPPIEGLETSQADAPEMAPLKISPDKPEIIELDRPAVNVLVGNEENLRAVPDTNRTIILVPKKPGATYFKALDAEGKVIMQRHVIIGAAKNEYVRIRRACINGQEGCKQYSLYYCPDSCHEVDVIQNEKAASSNNAAPQETSANPPTTTPNNSDEPVKE
ncbi:MAG: pilus assembly protein N-terminal domain-containing protein [Alphaproteobacteria bacterium]|nr:pilus assembly protein N-terminal domain-containing protein [Alphaproteobacteria bacterium]OIN87723.1 MAG: hypothetical protein AUJ12_01045 [Alphaproteobacteria bacterium CG1_02_46_17]